MDLKGVILAGGLGKRLDPLTRVTNKHLLPVYNQPMIYYPIRTLVQSGIKNILIVTGEKHIGDFKKLLGNGKELGAKNISYAVQKGEGGIAAALILAEHFVGNDQCVVILGDNVFEYPIRPFVEMFKKQKTGARVLIKKVADPKRFGVVKFGKGKIVSILEKPKVPPSLYIVTGIYMYDHNVFDFIRTIRPSGRGELEITDVNNVYLKRSKLSYNVLKGNWTDCGTFSSLFKANRIAAAKYFRE